MLNNLKIGPKLIGGFLLGTLITTVIGLNGLRVMNLMQHSQETTFHNGVLGVEHLSKTAIVFLRLRSRVQNMLRVNTPEYTASGEKALEKYLKEMEESMSEFDKHSDAEELKAGKEEYKKNHPLFLKDLQDVRDLLKAGNAAEAGKLFDEVDAKSWDAHKQILLKMIDQTVEVCKGIDDKADAQSSSAERTMWIMLVIALGAGLAMGLILTNSITAPLKSGLTMMNALCSGRLQDRLRLTRGDEIGQLANAMDRFADDLANIVVGSMKKLSVGDLAVNVVPKDDRDEISPAINKTAESLRGLVDESKTLTAAALEGRLSTRGDADKFQGGYRDIVKGVNDTLDAVIKPVQDAAGVLERIANKDMTARVTSDYQGDHAKIKEAVNLAAETLDQSLQQVAVGADQIASASTQIGTGAQALAQGTSEQASSLEEVSSSLQEMTAMTRQNSANAKEARGIAEATKTSAENGVASMQRLSAAMDLIKKSSDDTAKIIKTIDEIAFQTNLLALNAAVEAARAGEAGKGFAVVAEEVRNLAMRSAEAAKNTANMIEGSVKNSENGVTINQEVMKNLEEINGHAKRVSEVMAEIAAASDQQSQGVGQVNSAIEQMNQLTQQNAANSEESASASEELSAQSQEMRAMVAGFKISRSLSASPSQTSKTAGASSFKPALAKVTSKKTGKAEEAFPLETSSNGHDAFKDF